MSLDGPDPDAWDEARYSPAPRPARPNRDALGQSLRAACAVLVVALIVVAVVLLPDLDAAVRYVVGFGVAPTLVSALFVALVAWSSPRRWQVRTYVVGVAAFTAVIALGLVLSVRP